MSDPTGSRASNPASGALPAGFDMLEKMWSMMRLPPFAGMPSGAGAQALNPSLTMMSDMVSPLTNVEELDKRITDMRAVEQWLKLNLSMLQSAIQALEVQRATLATLKAFGAFAQTSMESAAHLAAGAPADSGPARARAAEPEPEATAPPPPGAPGSAAGGAGMAAMDPAAWWNALQAQFNQIAGLAMAAAGADPAQASRTARSAPAQPVKAAGSSTPKPARKAAPRRKGPKAAG